MKKLNFTQYLSYFLQAVQRMQMKFETNEVVNNDNNNNAQTD